MSDDPVVVAHHGKPRFAVIPLLWVLTLIGCESGDPSPPVYAEIGQPLPGLTQQELARFEAGRAVFSHPFLQEEGLGPRFNENACNACHTFPTDGGTGETQVTKATRLLDDGTCDLLIPQGGENVRIQVTHLSRIMGGLPEPTVEGATHTGRFSIPFVYGLGLIDAIPVETLQELADPDDLDADGISGRTGIDGSGRAARFGRKADVASLSDFSEGAFRLEMGMTTHVTPDESRAGSLPPVPDRTDPKPEPEIDEATLTAAVDFMRFLAPPARTGDATDPQVARGQSLFDTLGCAGCHVPVLRAGPDPSPAIANQAIALFSDLLLHDMGPGLTGTCAPGATITEYRTEPLMGLGHREIFLHDGRVGRVIDAVLLHGGEAQTARDAFAALDRVTQEAVLRFLNTL
jgi:CxxC motif-containing protein (DUF1111 family)